MGKKSVGALQDSRPFPFRRRASGRPDRQGGSGGGPNVPETSRVLGLLMGWTGGAPRSTPASSGGLTQARSPAMPRHSKDTVAILGIDIGKNTFHLVGLNKRSAIVLRQKLSRRQLQARLAAFDAAWLEPAPRSKERKR